jgi:hypothetical protein
VKRCPYCSEEIQASARKCRFCGEWLDDSAAPAGAGSLAEVSASDQAPESNPEEEAVDSIEGSRPSSAPPRRTLGLKLVAIGIPVAAALALTIVLTIGPGEGPVLFRGPQIEQLIMNQIPQQTGVPIRGAICHDVELREGDTTNCTFVFANGGSQTFRITATVEDGRPKLTMDLP